MSEILDDKEMISMKGKHGSAFDKDGNFLSNSFSFALIVLYLLLVYLTLPQPKTLWQVQIKLILVFHLYALVIPLLVFTLSFYADNIFAWD